MAGHKRPILWSSEARADLNGIWIYYLEVAGQSTADKIIRDIIFACRLLEDHPLAGRSRDDVRVGLRSVVTNPYVVFYRVGNDEIVEIVRVLDARQDIEEIFAT